MKKFGLVLVLFLITAVSFASKIPMSVSKEVKTGLHTCSIVDGDLVNQLNETFILKKFSHIGTWIQEVMSKDNWVSNNIISIPKRKGDNAPTVLINNNVYPIASSGREDERVVVSLNKYDTENREVTDDELYAVAYDKEGDINLELKEELESKTVDHALHSISPLENTTDTPVLETTGAADGTRKRLCKADIIAYKGKLDKLSVPLKGRVLVLSTVHANDLLLEDAAFEKGYHNRVDGTISKNYYSFIVYEEVYTPTYGAVSKQKLAFGSATAGRNSSIVFHKQSVVKSKGTVTRYSADAKTNPKFRKSEVGYRVWFGCFAIMDQGQGALIDGVVV